MPGEGASVGSRHYYVVRTAPLHAPESSPKKAATKGPLERLLLNAALLELEPRLECRPSREEVAARARLKRTTTASHRRQTLRSRGPSLDCGVSEVERCSEDGKVVGGEVEAVEMLHEINFAPEPPPPCSLSPRALRLSTMQSTVRSPRCGDIAPILHIRRFSNA